MFFAQISQNERVKEWTFCGGLRQSFSSSGKAITDTKKSKATDIFLYKIYIKDFTFP